MGMSIEELQDMIASSHLTDWNKELADPDSLVKYDELKNRMIWIWDINDSTLDTATRYIIAWNREDIGKKKEERMPIKLCVYSLGGSVDVAFNLISVMQASVTPCYTYNMGLAYSSGFLIFLAGEKGHRYTLDHASFLTHMGSGVMSGSFEEVETGSENYKADVKWMKEFILSHCKIPAQTLSKKWRTSFYINTDQALKWEIADKTIETLDELFV